MQRTGAALRYVVRRLKRKAAAPTHIHIHVQGNVVTERQLRDLVQRGRGGQR